MSGRVVESLPEIMSLGHDPAVTDKHRATGISPIRDASWASVKA